MEMGSQNLRPYYGQESTQCPILYLLWAGQHIMVFIVMIYSVLRMDVLFVSTTYFSIVQTGAYVLLSI